MKNKLNEEDSSIFSVSSRLSFAFFLFARYKNPSELGSRSLMRQLLYL